MIKNVLKRRKELQLMKAAVPAESYIFSSSSILSSDVYCQ